MREESRLLVCPECTLVLRFCVQELRLDTRYAALGVFADKLRESLLGVVPLEEFRDFNRVCRFVQHGSGAAIFNLQPCSAR